MEAYLVDLPYITTLLSGKSNDSIDVIEKIRKSSPDAWEFDPDYDEASEGQVLESLLLKGKWSGVPHLSGRALQLLCREFGIELSTDSFDDCGFMFVAEVTDGILYEDYFFQRVPPPLKDWGGNFPVVGYFTAEEATEVLDNWLEPDYDDPEPEVYAGREQIEDWLAKALESKKTLIMFWE